MALVTHCNFRYIFPTCLEQIFPRRYLGLLSIPRVFVPLKSLLGIPPLRTHPKAPRKYLAYYWKMSNVQQFVVPDPPKGDSEVASSIDSDELQLVIA